MRISDWSSDVCSSDLGGDDIRAHVGWYLADAGVPQLERDLGLRRGPLASIRSGWRHTPLLAYVVPIAAVVALFATGLISDARAILDQRRLLWLVGVLAVVRWEERRAGKEGGRTCRFRVSPEY